MSVSAPTFDQSKRIVFLWLSAPLFTALAVFSATAWTDDLFFAESLEQLGVLLVVLCVAGRCWSTLYIGGRKNAALIVDGPYRYMRNPLYFFSTLGLAGIGLVLESLMLAAALTAFGYLTFALVARREERTLHELFGAEYEAYRRQVPAFFPMPRAGQGGPRVPETATFSPQLLTRTFIDASYFLLIFPFAELMEILHDQGIVPAFLHLY